MDDIIEVYKLYKETLFWIDIYLVGLDWSMPIECPKIEYNETLRPPMLINEVSFKLSDIPAFHPYLTKT